MHAWERERMARIYAYDIGYALGVAYRWKDEFDDPLLVHIALMEVRYLVRLAQKHAGTEEAPSHARRMVERARGP